MPNRAKPHVILRQWEMLRLIPNCDHPGRSVQDLATALKTRGYPVTRRTVERDLDTLQQCMPLELNDNVRPQRWRWQRARSVDIPGMESAEAMALFMMQDAMRSHLPSCFVDALQGRFAQANKTLTALARSGANVRWADRVRVVPSHVVLKPPRIATRVVQTLQKAVLNDISVEAEYQSLQEVRPSSRLLYPRALILRGSSLYLIAHQRRAADPRTTTQSSASYPCVCANSRRGPPHPFLWISFSPTASTSLAMEEKFNCARESARNCIRRCTTLL